MINNEEIVDFYVRIVRANKWVLKNEEATILDGKTTQFEQAIKYACYDQYGSKIVSINCDNDTLLKIKNVKNANDFVKFVKENNIEINDIKNENQTIKTEVANLTAKANTKEEVLQIINEAEDMSIYCMALKKRMLKDKNIDINLTKEKELENIKSTLHGKEAKYYHEETVNQTKENLPQIENANNDILRTIFKDAPTLPNLENLPKDYDTYHQYFKAVKDINNLVDFCTEDRLSLAKLVCDQKKYALEHSFPDQKAAWEKDYLDAKKCVEIIEGVIDLSKTPTIEKMKTAMDEYNELEESINEVEFEATVKIEANNRQIENIDKFLSNEEYAKKTIQESFIQDTNANEITNKH